MKKVLCLLVLSLVLVFSANAQGLKDYVGKYEFSEEDGTTPGGAPVVVGHDLEIKADGGVTLTANGFQTGRDLLGVAKFENGKLNIYFTLYNDGANSTTPYDGDELLLTLEWKTVAGKKVLWTTFGKYKPALITAKRTGGVYFKKSKD
ncbi:MAG: hypothetical protein K1X72_25750 [Pyrinomonadaceae bacterium]|nr:hypothetical protein [Pyrinomonadaceae bacterium]